MLVRRVSHGRSSRATPWAGPCGGCGEDVGAGAVEDVVLGEDVGVEREVDVYVCVDGYVDVDVDDDVGVIVLVVDVGTLVDSP